MKRLVATTCTALALAAGAFVGQPAHAQPAAAIGHPLPAGDLPPGTVTVRIVAGSPAAPVAGSDAVLIVGGQPRTARTDASGRATFAGLPPGTPVQAKILDADGKEILSDEFAVPAQGGVRVMMSTKPFTGTAGMPGAIPAAGPGAGGPAGAGAMPPPRQMSGQPQEDRATVPGTFSVRVTYNELTLKDGAIVDPNPPARHPVFVVAYSADDKVKVLTAQTQPDGVAVFEGLDQSGGTAYYAVTALPRGAVSDRLVAVGAIPDAQAGMRVVLSGEKRDSTAPPIDDHGKLIPRDGRAVAPNRVRVTLDGVPQAGLEITLRDASSGAVIATLPAGPGVPDPAQVRGSANFNPASSPAGTLVVDVRGGMGTDANPLPGVAIQLLGASDDQPIAGGVGTTGPDGTVTLAVPADKASAVKAVMTVNGKQLASAGMDVSKAGGKLDITAQWPAQGRPEASFELPYAPGQVLYAETAVKGVVFRSLPVLTVPDAGSLTTIYVYPRTLFAFDTHSFVEDQLLAFQGSIEVSNYAWAPFRAGPDGLVIKLPRGYKGAIVAPQDQADVSVAQGEGFRLMRPIPPGGRKFRMGYSMPIEDGQVSWLFDLPYGTWRSAMKIRQVPGMKVLLPQGVTGQTMESSTGEPWFVVDNITLDPGARLAMTISGFPAEAAWRYWAPRLTGLLVLVIMLGGIGYAFARTRPQGAGAGTTAARREALLEELVELDRRASTSGKDRQRREQLVSELERLWGE